MKEGSLIMLYLDYAVINSSVHILNAGMIPLVGFLELEGEFPHLTKQGKEIREQIIQVRHVSVAHHQESTFEKERLFIELIQQLASISKEVDTWAGEVLNETSGYQELQMAASRLQESLRSPSMLPVTQLGTK